MVKRSILLAFYSCAFICWLTPIRSADDAVPVEPQKVQVVFDGKVTAINDTKVPLPTTRAELTKLFGEPTRVLKLAYTILTWDEHGVYATENPKTVKVEAFTVALDERAYKYWPKKMFAGTVQVNGASITAHSTIDDINRALKEKAFVRNKVVEDTWTMTYDDVVLTLVEADPKTKSEKTKFSYLQIGVKKK